MKLHPRLTAEGVLLARRAERFRPVAERDGRGWVVGYGHRAGAREGARVGEADATALLAYDLSQGAAQVEAMLRRPVPPELFDTLNAYALRVGPEAFAGSEALRRANGPPPTEGGQASTPERPDPGPPSAVLAAAASVRDRVSQVLEAAEPPPAPRQRREPWPDPAPPPSAYPDEGEDAQIPARSLEAPAHEPPAPAPAPRGSTLQDERADEAFEIAEAPGVEQGAWPPPSVAPPPPARGGALASPAVTEAASGRAFAQTSFVAFDAPAGAAPPASAPAPIVSFERGGRARLWDRVRGNPYVYMAVGACGLVLFACALLGFLLGRPTGPGLALGVTGVICLAPALAFFLHRREGPPS